MWIKKSEDEIREYLDWADANERSLLSTFLRPFIIALIVALMAVGYGPNDFIRVMLFKGIVIFSITFAIASYYYRKKKRADFLDDQLLCSECKQPSFANPKLTCECGGRLEPFGFYRWVEDRPEA